MTDQEFESTLMETVEQAMYDTGSEFLDVRTFEGAGVLTYNKGLVVTSSDGDEFQVTIVRSR